MKKFNKRLAKRRERRYWRREARIIADDYGREAGFYCENYKPDAP